MNKSDLLEELELCNECKACFEVCPVYKATHREVFSPASRLSAAKKILSGEEVTAQMIESIYNCCKCQLCESICPQGISITSIIHEARVALAEKGIGPTEKHNRVIEGIQRLGNSVNGDPSKRLEWLPEEFVQRESETLFFVGCLPSYLVQEVARSSYLLLKRLGFNFMILRDEGCCGVYFYDSGRTDLAREKFEENAERFRKLGIKRVVVACAGCYRCFKRYYPQLLGHVDFETVHIVELLPSLLKEKEMPPKRKNLKVIYQDPCRLGRMEGLYQQPRELLELCGVKVREMPQNKEKALCCGAGAGIRSVYPHLSLELASRLLDHVDLEHLVSSCPFCTFNLRYALKKTGREKTIKIDYITQIVLDSLY